MSLGNADLPRRIIWIRSSKRDLQSLPKQARIRMGHALWVAQQGAKHPDAKPMRGFGGAGVVEMTADFYGDTYRAIYTVKFVEAVYVLHVFQKKSKSGISTPQKEIELIKDRLKYAEALHADRIVRGAP